MLASAAQWEEVVGFWEKDRKLLVAVEKHGFVEQHGFGGIISAKKYTRSATSSGSITCKGTVGV